MRRARKLRARIRDRWQHKTTTDMTRRFGVIVLEVLKTRNMSASAKGTVEKPSRNVQKKAGLNRSILNVGCYVIQQKLEYKAAAQGGEIRLVNQAYTSQTCAECGVIDKTNRESQAGFECRFCGLRSNADTNAACNILKGGTRPAPSGRVARSSKQRESRLASYPLAQA